jgi:hypothetical protein
MKIKKNGKVITLTESDLNRIVKRVLIEQEDTTSDLEKCLSQKGFGKNAGGQYVNPKFDVYHNGEKLVRVFIQIESNNVVLVKVLDGDKQIVLPNNRFKWNQNCSMFTDLLKNRIKEVISNKVG